MICRGIRGAIAVEVNQAEAIVTATRKLLECMVTVNQIAAGDVASVIFSTTPDLDADVPARAAREMGWHNVPLLCLQEMHVPGSLPCCIRILIHWNTDRSAKEIQHVYLGEARSLRPDLATTCITDD